MPNNRADIYRVAEELKLDSDQLLRLTEPPNCWASRTIAQGDITLTPLGETFAEAGVVARKAVFAVRIRRLPVFQWILGALRDADRNRIERSALKEALEQELLAEEVEPQIDIVVDWGRYRNPCLR